MPARSTAPAPRLIDAGATVSVTLDKGLDGWRGDATLALARLRHAAAELRTLTGTVDFAGKADGTAGKLNLKSGIAAMRGAGAVVDVSRRHRTGSARMVSPLTDEPARATFCFREARWAKLARHLSRHGRRAYPWRLWSGKAVDAAAAATQSADLDADFSVTLNGGSRAVRAVSRLQLATSLPGLWPDDLAAGTVSAMLSRRHLTRARWCIRSLPRSRPQPSTISPTAVSPSTW